MILHSKNIVLLDEKFAPALRFMQDQALCYVSDLAYAAPFPKRVADWVSQLKIITEKQVEALDKVIAKRGWIEPPRWRPYAVMEEKYHFGNITGTGWKLGPVYSIRCCPGAIDFDAHVDEIVALKRAAPDGVDGEITIGEICEYTRDMDDPRLEPLGWEKRRGIKAAPYTTVCRRLVEEARLRGKLIEYPVTETGK